MGNPDTIGLFELSGSDALGFAAGAVLMSASTTGDVGDSGFDFDGTGDEEAWARGSGSGGEGRLGVDVGSVAHG